MAFASQKYAYCHIKKEEEKKEKLCDNKHTFGKQMPPDLAMLLAFLIETVDCLDNNTHFIG